MYSLDHGQAQVFPHHVRTPPSQTSQGECIKYIVHKYIVILVPNLGLGLTVILSGVYTYPSDVHLLGFQWVFFPTRMNRLLLKMMWRCKSVPRSFRLLKMTLLKLKQLLLRSSLWRLMPWLGWVMCSFFVAKVQGQKSTVTK